MLHLALLTTLAAVAITGSAVTATAAPALRYELDEGSGATAVNTGSLGAGSNGGVHGATWSSDSAYSTGFSLLFDGDTDYIETPDTFDYGNEVTVEAWIKPAVVSGQQAIYDDYGSPGVFLAIVDGVLEWNITTTTHTGLGIAIFDGELCENLWQHVAGTYDGSTLRAYINGVEVGTAATSGNILDNSGNATHIGADSATPSFLEYVGRIDSFRLHTSALPAGELGDGASKLVCGEVTGDCRITTTDALATLQMAVGTRAANPAADLDFSSTITAKDALEDLRVAVSAIPQRNACNGI